MTHTWAHLSSPTPARSMSTLDGRRVARPESARWCLRLLDGLQELAVEHGRFDPEHRDRQLGDLADVLDRARASTAPSCDEFRAPRRSTRIDELAHDVPYIHQALTEMVEEAQLAF